MLREGVIDEPYQKKLAFGGSERWQYDGIASGAFGQSFRTFDISHGVVITDI